MTTPEPHSSLILANIYLCLPSGFLSSGMKWDAATAADKRRAISIRTGSSWQSSCEFTAATVSGGCSFNAHQLAGSSAAVNQRIEGRILLQQHDDDHEPAGFMLQQVGIREEQWNDNSNHHHLQTRCNDLPGQQQQVTESSWWGQKRVKTSQGFGFNMVTSSCATVEAQPAAANPSPDQLEHGCVMQSRWKTKT
ncbi:unnamed protein product [Sphagnum tenellum]